jgi:arylsulfatase A-like enzyme/Flp pilus assembly protein TadD
VQPHFSFVLLAALLLLSCDSHPKDAIRREAGAQYFRPLNVVLVTIDTLRPDHLHCYGYQRIETPVADQLARKGVLFENAVTQTPLTPPSHASIFTGQYPNVHGVRSTGGFILPSSAKPLAKILKEQGWDTAAFVSSVVLKKTLGFANGFAVYDDQMPRMGSTADVREEPERSASDTVDRAVQWLARAHKPFFLWVHLYDPHMPYKPPGVFRTKYAGRLYDGEIAYTDQQLGRLLDAVQKTSRAEETLTSVLSDHGESLSEHGEFTHGVFLYDSTLRIAFLMAGPGIPSGMRVKQQVRSIDFLPTVLSLLGDNIPSNVQGLSLVPAFSGGSVPTEISYEETLYPKMAMGWAELRGIRTNHWKYIRAPKPELYDVAQDPTEKMNVLAQHPEEIARLEAQLKHIVGTSGREKVKTKMVDDQLMEQLRSLGYLAGSSPLEYDLTGQGTDPKDRISILKLLELAESSQPRLPEAQRLALLQQAVKQDSSNPSLYYQLGGELEKTGQYGKAVTLYQTALRRGVEDGRLHSRIADLSLRSGNKDRAIAEYEKAAQVNPLDLDSQTNLATAYLEKGRATDAERVLQWVLTNDAENPAAHNALGLIAIQRHDMPAAQAQFEKAVRGDPDLVEAQMNLGLIYEMAGDRARARACFEAFLAKAPRAQYANIIPKVREELATLQ